MKITFKRFEKWNEKHQGVIVKTNKQFLEQQKQMFQPATVMQQEKVVHAEDGQAAEACFFSEDVFLYYYYY